MHSTGLTVQAFRVAAPLHKMAFVQECKQKAINEMGYGGASAGEEDKRDWDLCLACCSRTDSILMSGLNVAGRPHYGDFMSFLLPSHRHRRSEHHDCMTKEFTK